MSVSAQDASRSSSATLVERLKAQDQEAWRRLTELYGPLVFGWMRRAGLQEADAADLLQEVFRSVSRAIDSFRRECPGDSFRGWLWTIARNKLRDHLRARQARPDAVGGTDAFERFQQLPDFEPDRETRSETIELFRRAIALIETDFEETTFQAFYRTAVNERPAAEVARELGLSLAAVYTAKSRVLARLRQELSGLGEV